MSGPPPSLDPISPTVPCTSTFTPSTPHSASVKSTHCQLSQHCQLTVNSVNTVNTRNTVSTPSTHCQAVASAAYFDSKMHSHTAARWFNSQLTHCNCQEGPDGRYMPSLLLFQICNRTCWNGQKTLPRWYVTLNCCWQQLRTTECKKFSQWI